MTLLDRDRLYGYDRYKRGDNWVTDDRTEARIRRSDSREEWTGAIVTSADWEPRNAGDFVQGIPDDQSVPDPRPVPAPGFLGPAQTSLTADAPAGSVLLPLSSTFGMVAGDRVGIPLIDLSIFQTTILAVVGPTSLTINARLPNIAPSGGTVIDYSAIQTPDLDS